MLSTIIWYIDWSHCVHYYSKGYTRAGIIVENDRIINTSKRHNFNAATSTHEELVIIFDTLC